MEIVIQFFKHCFSSKKKKYFVKLHRFSKPSFKRTFRPQRTPLVAAARTGARTLIPKVTPKDHPKLIVGVVDVGSSVGDRSTLLHPPSPGWQKKVTARLAPQHLCSGGFWTCPRLTLAPMSSCPRLSTNNLRQRKKRALQQTCHKMCLQRLVDLLLARARCLDLYKCQRCQRARCVRFLFKLI